MSKDLQNKSIKYTSPATHPDQELPQHLFELVEGDEVISSAEIDYFSKPLPFYQLSALWTEYEHQHEGNASLVMDAVEQFLRTRRKPGVLVDAITEREPAYGMYERRGWQKVPGSYAVRAYNWPDDVPLTILRNYPDRSTPLSERSPRTRV